MNDQQQNNLKQSGRDDLTNEAQDAANKNENVTSDAVNLSKSRLQTQDDNSITSTGINELQSNSNDVADTDSAGAPEQKTYGDINLNKGLEAQAKDEES